VATTKVVTLNVPVVPPAGMLMDVTAGLAAVAIDVSSATVTPPAGAADASVTVAVTVVAEPPVTIVGLSVRFFGVVGLMARMVDLVLDPSVAVSVTFVVVATEVGVVITTVPVEEFAGIVTVAGTLASEWLDEERLTTCDAGSALRRVTVSRDVFEPPPSIGFGLADTALMMALEFTVNTPVAETDWPSGLVIVRSRPPGVAPAATVMLTVTCVGLLNVTEFTVMPEPLSAAVMWFGKLVPGSKNPVPFEDVPVTVRS